MAENQVSELQKLPSEEIAKLRASILMVPMMPKSWRTRAVSQLSDHYISRARFYVETGKLPEDVERERERDETRRVLPWLLAMILGALLFLVVLHQHGITSDCDSPDVVFGGCDSYE